MSERLKGLAEAGMVAAERSASLQDDPNQSISILTAIVKKAKKRMKDGL